MSWLRTAGRWLLSAAVAIPALLALLMWGQRWRDKAKSAEVARKVAWDAAEAARVRAVKVSALAHAKAQSRKVLAAKLRAAESEIAAREAEVQALASGADRVNAAFQLEAPDGPSLGDGPVVESTYNSGPQ